MAALSADAALIYRRYYLSFSSLSPDGSSLAEGERGADHFCLQVRFLHVASYLHFLSNRLLHHLPTQPEVGANGTSSRSLFCEPVSLWWSHVAPISVRMCERLLLFVCQL